MFSLTWSYLSSLLYKQTPSYPSRPSHAVTSSGKSSEPHQAELVASSLLIQNFIKTVLVIITILILKISLFRNKQEHIGSPLDI